MSRNEYLREIVKGELDAAHIREMQENGWKPRAVEWEREVTAAGRRRAASGGRALRPTDRPGLRSSRGKSG